MLSKQLYKDSLYKDSQNGKIAGVCAGIAQYFSIEIWLVRILFITVGLLGGGFLAIIVYLALSLLLDKAPKQWQQQLDEQHNHKLKSKPWQQGKNVQQLLTTLNADMQCMESKLQHIEAYVTSDTFKVTREFNNL